MNIAAGRGVAVREFPVKGGELIGILLLDHVIIGAGTYTSLAEGGRMKS